ncbi:hypothetical protein J132_09987 [Termitomyces sp. J132]|nr:hypothetical protein C0989_008631 [Termitomyces sp. Mn162]KNZ79433.1 hypothetical protein J132_09987 [Termitomyces sp. J132]
MHRVPLYAHAFLPQENPPVSPLSSSDSGGNPNNPMEVQSLIENMVEDNASEELEPNKEVDNGEVYSLEINADGEGCSMVSWSRINKTNESPFQEAYPRHMPSLMLWDQAINKDDIQNALEGIGALAEHSGSDISMSSLPSIIEAYNAKPMSPIRCPLSDANSASTAQEQAIAMQEMLEAHDQLSKKLQRLLILGVNDKILEQYTSPYLHPYIFGGLPNPARLRGSLEKTSNDRPSKFDENMPFLPLLTQKKER